MYIVKPKIDDHLSLKLKQVFQTHVHHFTTTHSKLINSKLLYCNKWTENKYEDLIPLLYAECEELQHDIDNYTLVQINIINAPPDCVDQLFHIDYLGDSISYYIPFVELTDKNGTVFVRFIDPQNHLVYYDELLKMSALYLTQVEIVEHFLRLDLKLNIDYTFTVVNSPAFSLIKMPNYVYHRGQTNKSGDHRLMLNILFSINNDYEFPIQEIVPDSELDEPEKSTEEIFKRRRANL